MEVSAFYRHIAPLERKEKTERRSPFPTNKSHYVDLLKLMDVSAGDDVPLLCDLSIL